MAIGAPDGANNKCVSSQTKTHLFLSGNTFYSNILISNYHKLREDEVEAH